MWVRLQRVRSALLLGTLSFLAACIVPYENNKPGDEQRAITPQSNGFGSGQPARRY